jgi:hypothetical protein
MNSHCLNCGGAIPEPGKTYGYAGKWCYCPVDPALRYQRPSIKDEFDFSNSLEFQRDLAKMLKANNADLQARLEKAEELNRVYESALHFYSDELLWLRARVEARWDISFGKDDGQQARLALAAKTQKE